MERYCKAFISLARRQGYDMVDIPRSFALVFCKRDEDELKCYMLYNAKMDNELFKRVSGDNVRAISGITPNDLKPVITAVIIGQDTGKGEWADMPYDHIMVIDPEGEGLEPTQIGDPYILPIAAAHLSGSSQGAVKANQSIPKIKNPIFLFIFMGINALMFLIMELAGGSESIPILIRFGAANFFYIFEDGEYWRFITPIFLHIGITHLAFNSFSLILFGIRAERHFGHAKFVIIYVATGVIGNLAMVLTNNMSVGAGASGAIYGILGALIAYTKLKKQNIENFDMQTLLIMTAMGIGMGFLMPNIGNAAHLGGLLSGFVLGLLLF